MLSSKIEAKTELNIKTWKYVKFDSGVHGSSIFKGQGGSKIDEKSMPKRLQDKSGVQAPKNHEKVSNIGPSWGPKSSQVALKIKEKVESILSGQKQRPKWKSNQKLPRV